MASPRRRLRYTFWLDLYKDEEFHLAELIEWLKENRLFTRTIRDGIRLILDLRQGRTEVLNELFPWVMTQQQPEVLPNQLSEFFAAYESTVTQQLSELEQKLLQAGPPALSAPNDVPQLPRRTSTIDFESDERLNLTVEKAQASDENPTYNMLISVASIDATGFIGLDLEVLEYGIKQGKIPPQFLDQKKALLAARKNNTSSEAVTNYSQTRASPSPIKMEETQPTIPIEVPSAKVIAGSDLAFSAPDLDEMELDNW